MPEIRIDSTLSYVFPSVDMPTYFRPLPPPEHLPDSKSNQMIMLFRTSVDTNHILVDTGIDGELVNSASNNRWHAR